MVKPACFQPGHLAFFREGGKDRAQARLARGTIMMELVVALAILTAVVFPIAFGFLLERRIVRDTYREAVVMEILDGEAELLQAGAWKSVAIGTSEYVVNAESKGSLPPGRFWVSRDLGKLRLEWRAEPGVKLRSQSREFPVP